VSGVNDLLELSPSTQVYQYHTARSDGRRPIQDGQKFETEGATLRAFHCPGHTDDHMAFILEEEDAMFTADNVLGQGTAVFEDLALYMKSLDGMRQQFTGRAYPGHGPVIVDGPAKISEYIKHRKEREKQVLDVLSHDKEGGWTAMDIVKIIYKGYPENLYEPAKHGIELILRKLLDDGKVEHNEEKDTWSLKKKPAL
jgi:endoribonuclease LACTB2